MVLRIPRQPIFDVPLAAAIGEFIAAWSGAQMGLVMLMADLMLGRKFSMDNEEDVFALVPLIGMDPRTQIALLRTLLHQRLGDDVAAPIDKILDRLYSLKRQRDMLAHGVWEFHAKTGNMYAHSLKMTFPAKGTRVQFTAHKVQELAIALDDHFVRLIEAVQPHGYLLELQTWRDRRGPPGAQ